MFTSPFCRGIARLTFPNSATAQFHTSFSQRNYPKCHHWFQQQRRFSTMFDIPGQTSSRPQPDYLRQQNYEPPAPGALIERFGPGKTAITAAFVVAGVIFFYSTLDLKHSLGKAIKVVDELKGMSEKDFIFQEMTKAYYSDLKQPTPERVVPHTYSLTHQPQPSMISASEQSLTPSNDIQNQT